MEDLVDTMTEMVQEQAEAEREAKSKLIEHNEALEEKLEEMEKRLKFNEMMDNREYQKQVSYDDIEDLEIRERYVRYNEAMGEDFPYEKDIKLLNESKSFIKKFMKVNPRWLIDPIIRHAFEKNRFNDDEQLKSTKLSSVNRLGLFAWMKSYAGKEHITGWITTDEFYRRIGLETVEGRRSFRRVANQLGYDDDITVDNDGIVNFGHDRTGRAYPYDIILHIYNVMEGFE